MADEMTRRRLMALIKKSKQTPGRTVRVGTDQRLLDVAGIDLKTAPTVHVYVFAAQPGDEGARPVEEVRQSWARPDGKLHIKDPFDGVPGGGREHVFDVPAGATHLQVFYELKPGT